MQAIGVEYRKFKRQMEEQGYVEAHSNDDIRAIFARSMSSPNIQQSITSYVSNASLQMKEVDARRFSLQPSGMMDKEIKTSRRLLHLGQDHRANRTTTGSSANSIMQKRVDDLYVEFGVRPARSAEKNVQTTTNTRCEVTDLRANEQVATRRAGGDLEEKTMTPEQHLDSIIQLKLKLAEKQTILDELSSKYIALQASVQKQRLESQFQANTEQNMLAVLTENSKLRQENESLRLKLRELQLGSSSTTPRDDYEHGLPEPNQQTNHGQQRPFNIHQVLQDRLKDGKKLCQNPPSQTAPSEFKLFQTSASTHSMATGRRRSSMVTEGSTATNDSVSLQHPAVKPLNSFSNLLQGWRRNNRQQTPPQSSDNLHLHRNLTMPNTTSILKPGGDGTSSFE